MQLISADIREGQPIDPKFAFGKIDPENHMAFADNLNPGFTWNALPAGTRSLALLCVDPDAPTVADDVNQEGKTLPADMERGDFYHWVMVDLDPDLEEIEQGSCSEGVTEGGRTHPPGPPGARQGMNNYTQFMAGTDLEGEYFGYDGPCPPWNDEKVHRYRFTLYALDVEALDVGDDFTGPDVLAAMQSHILDQHSITGTYTLNPDLA